MSVGYGLSVSGYAETKEIEKKVIEVLHEAFQRIKDIDESVFTYLSTDHFGNGSVEDVQNHTKK